MDLNSLLDGADRASGVQLQERVPELQDYVAQQPLDRDAFTRILDIAIRAARDTHFKTAVSGLQLLLALVTKSAQQARLHMTSVLSSMIDRLGDMKQPPRQAACELLIVLIQTQGFAYMLDCLPKAFAHRNGRVREAVLHTITAHIQQQALADLTSSEQERLLLPKLVTCLSDSQCDVRLAAQDCLTAMYAHLGETLSHMLTKHDIRPAQMKELLSRFDSVGGPPVRSSDAPVRPGCGVEAATVRPRTAGRRSTKPSHAGEDADAVVPVFINSEHELTSELGDISKQLNNQGHENWEKRIAALKRLQGIASGGAHVFPAFADLLKSSLREPLVLQISDRRSQVSRVACAAVASCAAASGQRFEPVVLALLPELFKVLVISIVVMADSADMCMRRIVHHCHSLRLMRLILDTIGNDKSVKLRQRCAEYLHQMLQEWPCHVFEHALPQIAHAIHKAVQDAGVETRAVGRTMYCTFYRSFPEHGPEVLKGLDRSTIDKLRKEVATAEASNGAAGSSLPDRPASTRPASAHHAPSAASTARGAPARIKRRASHSIPDATNAPSHNTSAPPGQPVATYQPAAGASAPPTLPAALRTFEEQQAQVAPQPLMWSSALALLGVVTNALQEYVQAPQAALQELAHLVPRLAKILEGTLSHKHAKVQHAALEALSVGLLASDAAFERAVKALLPPVLYLKHGNFAHVKPLACDVLDDMGAKMPADVLLEGLNVVMSHAAQATHAQLSALQFFQKYMGMDNPAGVPQDSRNLATFVDGTLRALASTDFDVRTSAVDVLRILNVFCADLIVQRLCSYDGQRPTRAEVATVAELAIPGISRNVDVPLFGRHTAAPHARPAYSRAERSLPAVADHGLLNGQHSGNVHDGILHNGRSPHSSPDIGMPLDTSMAEELINRALHNLDAQPSNCVTHLQTLRSLVRQAPLQAWKMYVGNVVAQCQRLITCLYLDSLKDIALLLREITEVIPGLMTPHLMELLNVLLDATCAIQDQDEQDDAQVKLKECLHAIASRCDAHTLMQYYAAKLPSRNALQNGTAYTAIAKLKRIASMAKVTIMRCKGDARLEQDILSLLPGLHATMDKNDARVRLNTTEAWVSAFSVLGSRLQPAMANLSTTQKRIVNLYINKMKAKDDQEIYV